MKDTHAPAVDVTAANITWGSGALRARNVAVVCSLAGFGATLALGVADPHRALLSTLVNWVFFLSITLGALFFVLIQHLTRAGWSVVVRRLAECLAANADVLSVVGLGLVLLTAGLGLPLFPWMDPAYVAGEPVVAKKAAYLNPTFFAIRALVCFAAWTFLSRWFYRQSRLQDESGDSALTVRMQQVSAPGMIVFALTLTVGAIDFLMSLEPAWFSTIYGVYYFSGCVVAACASMILLAWLLQRAGRLRGVVSVEHYHDLGKLVFAFTVFWTYIAFSQYMLYWYANIPEETVWFDRRQTGEWTAFSAFLFCGRFLAPFLALISRVPKRRRGLLAGAVVWVLMMQWMDLYYLAMPHASPGKVPFHLLDLTAFLGMGGLFVAALAQRLGDKPLIPRRDPRLAESLAFENF